MPPPPSGGNAHPGKEFPMRSHSLFTAIFTLCLLTACGKQAEPVVPKIAEPQRQALDQAKQVGATLQQGSEQQQQEINRQTDGKPAN
jgi:hypothetical protein